MKKTSIQANYNAQMAKTLRGLLECSPKTHKKTTYKKLSEHLGVKQQSVSSWANGTTIPDTKHIVPLAEFFGITCDYLLGREIAPTHTTTDICHETGLAPETVEVLSLYAKDVESNIGWAKVINEHDENGGSHRQNQAELGLKVLNHIIANCNALLNYIGLYWFEEFKGLESVKGKSFNFNLKEPEKHIRNGLLQTITLTLSNYRKHLEEKGGDLPLTWVLDTMWEEKRERLIKKRVDFLENAYERSLTKEEIKQERDFYEKDYRDSED